MQVFFEEIPEGRYDADGLVKALNDEIRQRGRTEAIGGTIEKRDHIPQEWKEAYREQYK